MRKIALLAFGLLLASPAYAVDNTLLVTPCASGCITTKSKDIGAGVQAPQPVISDTGGNPLATPTAGADGASNTSTGLQGYVRPSWWNGVTWDRAPGDVTNGAFVNVKTSVLPTGAATSAAQTTAQTSLSSIVTSTGASATAANQATMITSLGTIVTNTGAAIPAGSALIGKVGIDQTTPGTTNGVQVNAALPAGTNVIGKASIDQTTPGTTNLVQPGVDPCTYQTKINFTIATSSGTVQLVAPSGSTQVYICSLVTVGATASIQNLVGGTGATCTTGTPVAIAGSTTAASGMSFAANGGFTFGNGGGTVLRTTTAGHGVCLIQSATAAIAGGGTYVQQ